MASLIPSAGASGTGSLTLQGPSTSSTQTVTIPDATGTMMVSGNMPAFSAYPASAQTFANGSFVKVVYDTKQFDTASCYSTANSRFTPNIAGYYQVNGNITFGSASAGSAVQLGIYKNGSQEHQGVQTTFGGTYNGCSGVSALVYLNGSTDYIELYCIQLTGGSKANTNVSDAYANFFQAILVRTA